MRISDWSSDVCSSDLGDEHDARLAGGSRVTLRRMHGGLLMADQNVPDALLLEQRVIDRQHCAARIAEDHLDAQVLQRPDQYLRSAHFTGRHHKLLFRRSAERRRRYLLKYSASTLLCVTLLQTVAGPSGLYSENAAPLSGAA